MNDSWLTPIIFSTLVKSPSFTMDWRSRPSPVQAGEKNGDLSRVYHQWFQWWSGWVQSYESYDFLFNIVLSIFWDIIDMIGWVEMRNMLMSSKHHAAQSPRVSPGTVKIGENTQIMR